MTMPERRYLWQRRLFYKAFLCVLRVLCGEKNSSRQTTPGTASFY
jgi:hypothetical protein